MVVVEFGRTYEPNRENPLNHPRPSLLNQIKSGREPLIPQMVRPAFGMRTIDPHTPSFGSSHDPVLHGVAIGLADLFPPVEHPASVADESQDDPVFGPEITSEKEA